MIVRAVPLLALVSLWGGAPARAEGSDFDGDGICDRDEDRDGDGNLNDHDDDDDGLYDWQDPDDDGDGFPTRDEDWDGDGDPLNDDLDGNDTPDYLDEHVPLDMDQDGHVALELGGDDCDDDDPLAYPGAFDAWYDGRDRDCQGNDDHDADGDGWADERTAGGGDCDDRDPDIHPGRPEVLDEVDSDCDGWTDPLGVMVPRGGCSCDPSSTTGPTAAVGLLPWLARRRRR